jgi:methyl-accepting chemotaxis protein
MNKSRRKRIAVAIRDLKKTTKHNFIDNYIDFIKDEIEDILWEENDAYDNMPESLQYSVRGEESSEAIDNLQEAVDLLEEAINLINDINDIDDEDDEDNEKESKIDEIDDYINQAIDALEQII